MTIKRVTTVLLLLPLLFSCAKNKNKVAGEYVFQMGKSKDIHMGASLKLTNDAYDAENIDKGKKFELSLELAAAGEENDFAAIISEINPIIGFYNVNNEEKIYEGIRINMGLSLLGEVEIPDEMASKIFVANYQKNVVNFFLPVSIKDLTLQLYWYGIDLDMAAAMQDEEIDESKLFDTQEGPHPVGSHPTQEEIDQINTHYAADHDGETFRDYHVLKLGLTKR